MSDDNNNNGSLFSLSIKGKHSDREHSIDSGIGRSMREAAEMLSDLSGYRPEYIADRFLNRIKEGDRIVLGDKLGVELGGIRMIVRHVPHSGEPAAML